MTKLFTVRKVLTFLLVLSAAFAAFSAYYKIKYWGFDLQPNLTTNVWNIDAHISFKPTARRLRFRLPCLTPPKNLRFK